jgi:transcriptional regulator with XRE-family HTH domain
VSKKSVKTKKSVFAKNLKQILAERGISQRGAADLAKTNPSVINDWLSGTQPLNLDSVVLLCRALKCDFQWLLTGTRSELISKELSLSELFEVQAEPSTSGIFMIEAKRLKRRL